MRMGIHRRVKFPFEITRGKAEDLFRLRFIRKSELEPGVRHVMKHTVDQMDRQLDIWFREQLFTIGSLSREQEKVYRSRKRLKKEQRRIKKQEYVRYQEDVRQKLQEIRMKLMLMKVVKRFKDNVKQNREYREHEMGKRPNVDFLRVPGNEAYLWGSSSFDGNKSVEQGSKTEHKQKKHKMLTSATAMSSFETNTAKERRKDDFEKEIEEVGNLPEIGNEDVGSSGDYTNGVGQTVNGDSGMAVYGQNFLPPSSRMETIPEENLEEVELEIDDMRDDPKLTKRRLSIFNRSKSKRNIFDGSERVPLLPEVNNTRHHMVTHVSHPDTEDKETQTSIGSGDKEVKKHRSSRGHTHIKKSLVVKLPRSSDHHKRTAREDDVRSSTGNYGSDPERDSDGYVTDDDSLSDAIEGCTLEADLMAFDSDGWEGSNEESDTSTDLSYREKLHKSLSHSRKKKSDPIKNSGDLKKTLDSFKEYKTHFKIIPDEKMCSEFPSLVQKQDPRALQFKERSFYVAPDIIVRPSGSAKYLNSRQLEHLYGNAVDKTENEKLQEIKNRRLDDMQRKLSRDGSSTSARGKKSREQTTGVAPPNTPRSLSRQTSKSNKNVLTLNQKRAKASEWRNVHELSKSEPVQQYERTKSGKLSAFGSPRMSQHELPSMKDQYYRDKLLKAERDSIFNQEIKMKKFIDTFEKERVHADFQTVTSNSSGKTFSSSPKTPGTSIGNFLFKVCKPEQNMDDLRQKVVPSVSTTSVRMLKNCRYLREYTPMTEKERVASLCVKETSWKMDTRQSKYTENYIANVRLQLS